MKNSKNKGTITVVTFLNRDQIDYLDKSGKDSFFKFGHKVSRSKILSGLVDLLMKLEIDFEDIDLEGEELWKGIARQIKNEADTKV